MNKRDTIYIHTIDGCCGAFDGFQICFAANYGRPNTPATSLRQIRREQQTTIRNRKANKLSVDGTKYNYRRYVL